MALLPLPVLPNERAHACALWPPSTSLPYCSAGGGGGGGGAAGGGLYTTLQQHSSKSSKLVFARVAEVEPQDKQPGHARRPGQLVRTERTSRSSRPHLRSGSSRRIPYRHANARPRDSQSRLPFQRAGYYIKQSCHAHGFQNDQVGSAIVQVIEKLRSIQPKFEPHIELSSEDDASLSQEKTKAANDGRFFSLQTAGKLFLPRPDQDIFSIGNYWSTPDHPITAPGRGVLETTFPWEFDQTQEEKEEKKRVKPSTLAELLIPPKDLKRLRTEGIRSPILVKVGRLGITDNIADKIIGQWCSRELVKIKCGGPAAVNMMKIHKDLERKTGGLVIWRAGGVAVVYRGSDYNAINKVGTSLETKLEGLMSMEHLKVCCSKEISQHKKAEELLDENHDGMIVPKIANGKAEFPRAKIDHGFVEEEDVSTKAGVTSSIDVGAKSLSKDHEVWHGSREGTLMSHIDADKMVLQPLGTRTLNVCPDPFVDRDYEREIDHLLEDLGPRCEDWTGMTPVPVDADLLPPLVPNYRPPYRLLPYGVRPQLTNNEQTDLRRLVRHIAPHFALGRNRGLQGLAVAILKLWEKSEVAKIAIKRGVQNTSSEKMAEELKRCTGGVLLGRDRYYITLYRGKDFLPQQVARALTERTTMLRNLKKGEELLGRVLTAEEALQEKLERDRAKEAAEKARCVKKTQKLEEKLAMAVERIAKAKQDLERLEKFEMPANQPEDSEMLTEEERYMLRKLGLKMDPFLLVGRRGIFDGVVENMHLHWKHRELVKLIVKESDPAELQKTAQMLENESGGILVDVVSTSKGHAIIMYRGKNYNPPAELRPHNLLNKRKALQRSLEIQRSRSLTRHIAALEEEISKLKASLRDADNDENNSASKASSFDGLIEVGHVDKDVLDGDKDNVIMDDPPNKSPSLAKNELLELVEQGPIYRAHRLTNHERLMLRKYALKLGVGARFNVGKSNVQVELARQIRLHFLKHAVVIIGVKHRAEGISVQELVNDLEDLTGGVLVSHERNQIIMYRGWPKNEKMPASGTLEEVSPDLVAAFEAEEEDLVHAYGKS